MKTASRFEYQLDLNKQSESSMLFGDGWLIASGSKIYWTEEAVTAGIPADYNYQLQEAGAAPDSAIATAPTPVSEIADVVEQPVVDEWAELDNANAAAPKPETAPTTAFEGIETVMLRNAKLGYQVCPLKGKVPCVKGFVDPDSPNFATSDPGKIAEWAARFPDATGCILLARSIPGFRLFIDEDASEEFRAGYEAFAGKVFPISRTTESRPDHRQSHWIQTEYSLKSLKNIVQAKTKNKMFSLRFNNEYVLGEGSLHPKGSIYRVVVDAPAIPMPDKLVDYINSLVIGNTETQAATAVAVSPRNDDTEAGPINEGGRNDALSKFCFNEWQNKDVTAEELRAKAHEWNQENCVPPLPRAEVDATVNGKLGLARTGAAAVYIGDHIAGTAPVIVKTTVEAEDEESAETKIDEAARTAKIEQITALVNTDPDLVLDLMAKGQNPTDSTVAFANEDDEPEIETGDLVPWPEFPLWTIQGTSIYEGLVKPVCDASQKIPHLVWLAAAQMVLNYLSEKVRITYVDLKNLNLFLGYISDPGTFYKSSAVEIAHEYGEAMGIVKQHRGGSTNADGSVLITTPSSFEGFGKQMMQASAKHAVMFNDELGKFASKANIDGTSLMSDMLSMYESGKIQSGVKNPKDCYSFGPRGYCFSWIWCCTTKTFPGLWAKLGAATSGLDDRMFFVLTPKEPRPRGIPSPVDFKAAAVTTHQLLDKALKQGVYRIEDMTPLQNELNNFRSRSEAIAEKFALLFAIDLGRDEIDIDCLERGIAIAKYRDAVLRKLAPAEAVTREGQVQQEMIKTLQGSAGKMSYRDFCREMHYDRFGTSLWDQCLSGLEDKDDPVIEVRPARGKKLPFGKTRMIYLLKREG